MTEPLGLDYIDQQQILFWPILLDPPFKNCYQLGVCVQDCYAGAKIMLTRALLEL